MTGDDPEVRLDAIFADLSLKAAQARIQELEEAETRRREANALMRAALVKAEAFIADELETRQQSYLPDATEGEQDYIGDAERALKAVRDALKEGQ